MKHPVYKQLILLEGFFFNKSQFTHVLQQHASIRDQIVTKLCDDGIFIRHDIFAKKTSNERIHYLEGFVKVAPVMGGNPSNIEQTILFCEVLAQYDVMIEEYLQSFTEKHRSMRHSDETAPKYILNRSDIKLKSFLFSKKFSEFLQKNYFYAQRYTISSDAICNIDSPITPTTSNIRMLMSVSRSSLDENRRECIVRFSLVEVLHYSLIV